MTRAAPSRPPLPGTARPTLPPAKHAVELIKRGRGRGPKGSDEKNCPGWTCDKRTRKLQPAQQPADPASDLSAQGAWGGAEQTWTMAPGKWGATPALRRRQLRCAVVRGGRGGPQASRQLGWITIRARPTTEAHRAGPQGYQKPKRTLAAGRISAAVQGCGIVSTFGLLASPIDT